jgi:AcrR family transcriptional regulator
MFAERGFADVKIRDIATEAGAEAPTIYHYFGNKESLYRFACSACFERASKYALVGISQDRPVEQRLYLYVLHMFESYVNDVDFSKLMQRQLLECSPEELSTHVHKSVSQNFKALENAIVAFRPKKMAARITVALYSLIYGATRLSPLWNSAPELKFAAAATPGELAQFALTLVLPEIEWKAVDRQCRKAEAAKDKIRD